MVRSFQLPSHPGHRHKLVWGPDIRLGMTLVSTTLSPFTPITRKSVSTTLNTHCSCTCRVLKSPIIHISSYTAPNMEGNTYVALFLTLTSISSSVEVAVIALIPSGTTSPATISFPAWVLKSRTSISAQYEARVMLPLEVGSLLSACPVMSIPSIGLPTYCTKKARWQRGDDRR
jgi:hypothetical protein